MKKLLAVTIFLLIPILAQSQDFYYLKDKKQFFEIDSSQLLVEAIVSKK